MKIKIWVIIAVILGACISNAQIICAPNAGQMCIGQSYNGLAALQPVPAILNVLNGSTNVFTQVTGNDAADFSGNSLGNLLTQCVWTSSNTAVASFANQYSPVVTGVAPGTVTATCTQGTITGTATVNVSNPPVITNPPACATPPCVLSPSANNGSAYSYTFAATGGATPYTWDCNGSCAGLLPTGLSLSAGGVLSGTPTANGTTTWTVRVCVNGGCGGGSTTLSVSLVVAGCVAGPPSYGCSFSGTTDPNYGSTGVLAPLFTSTQYVGTVNTTNGASGGCASNCVTLATGDNFPAVCSNTQLNINNANFTIASCIDTTHIQVTTAPGTQTGVKYGHCEGSCQNSTAYDTTINPSGVNAYTVMADMGSVRNQQSIVLTCSGGSNNAAISSLGNYFAPALSGGGFSIYHIQITGGKVQVINTGVPALNALCPAGMGRAPADDQCLFFLSGSQLKKDCWDTNATTFTTNGALVVDFAQCPGMNGIPIANTSEITMSNNDDVFVQAVGNIGFQGGSTVVVTYKVSTNQCNAKDMYSGAIYGWCTPGTACAAEAPSGSTLATGGNTCWGIPKWTGTATVGTGGAVTWLTGQKFSFTTSQTMNLFQGLSCSPSTVRCNYNITAIASNTSMTVSPAPTAAQVGCGSLPCTVNYTVVNGVHGVQESGDGNYFEVSWGQQGGWAVSGVDNPSVSASLSTYCSGQTQPSSNQTIVKTDPTDTSSQWVNNKDITTQGISGYRGAGFHPSMGVNENINVWSTQPNFRSLSDVTHWTQFAPAYSNVVDDHGTLATYCTGTSTPTDNCYLEISDSPLASIGTGACGNPSYCPKYLNMAAFLFFPKNGGIQNPVVFGHNFVCGNATGAKCNDGKAGTAFNVISYTDPQGRFVCFQSDMLHNIGHDGTLAPQTTSLCMMMQ